MIKILKLLVISLFTIILVGCSKTEQVNNNQSARKQEINVASSSLAMATSSSPTTKNKISTDIYYKIVKVVDGDTIDVDINGKTERVRMIGINTPETVDPRKMVECFGVEASNKAKEWLAEQEVKLEADETQTDRDKYNRLLRYVWRKDGFFYNLEIIKQGYAYEYTFDLPYRYQKDFKGAQEEANGQKLGLWAENACTKEENTQNEAPEATSTDSQAISQPSGQTTPETTTQSQDEQPSGSSCMIKGNISSKKEKIYHVPGCQSYFKTVIDIDAGERWFCTEAEALSAGWRKALNCP